MIHQKSSSDEVDIDCASSIRKTRSGVLRSFTVTKRGGKELLRELKYYKHLESYLGDWRGLPRYYGEVETNLGTGYVYDKIVDFDGKASKTLVERFGSPKESVFRRQELVDIVNKLLRYLYDNRIVTMTLKPYNILCQRISETEIFPVVCDNIGEASFIPIASHSAWFCHLKQRRIFQRFLNQPIINCLNREVDGIIIP